MSVIKYQVIRTKNCDGRKAHLLCTPSIFSSANEAYTYKEEWDSLSDRISGRNPKCQCECEVKEKK